MMSDYKSILFFNKNKRYLELTEEDEIKDFLNTHIAEYDSDIDLDKTSVEDLRRVYANFVKSDVTNFIPNRIDNIVLFLGAGASVVSGNPSYGKTMKDLNKKCFSAIKDKSYWKGWDVKKLENILHLPLKAAQDIDLEKLISYMNLYIKLNFKEKPSHNSTFYRIKEIRDQIYETIKVNVSYNYDNTKMNHIAVINDLNDRLSHESKLNIITTNYDLMVEEAAALDGYTIFDGFTFERNPIFDADMFNWNLVKSVPNLNTKENIYRKKVMNLLKIHGSIDWFRGDDQKIHRGMASDKKPIMIFPSSDKYMQSYEDPYFELFTEFQSLLRRSNTLLVTSGFSFSDNHIAQMIMDALRNNESLRCLVTDYDIGKIKDRETYYKEKENDNWKKLREMASNTKSIVFLKATMNDKEHGLDYYLG